MSDSTYTAEDGAAKRLVWLHGEIKTPPFSLEARLKSGFWLRRLQQGRVLAMPHSRPMPSIGPHCHELRVAEATAKWRIIYRVDAEEIVIAEVFKKTTQRTPKHVIDACTKRFRRYDDE